MEPELQRALERAEARLRKVEGQLAEARAEVAQAMIAAGPAAVARRDGVTRQAVWDFIRRNTGEVSPDAPRKRPSRKPTR